MSDEQPAPYGTGPGATPGSPGAAPVKRVRTHHLREMKERGEKITMLTVYDMYTAAVFDEAGIDILFIGDSAANNVLGYATTIPVTVDELIPLVRAVSRTATRGLVLADLPFGSYQASPEQAFHTAVRFMKEADAHAVKLEGGAEVAPQVAKLATNGIPVMAHIGFTPQSEHGLGGHIIQGRGEGAKQLLADAHAVEEAGAFAVVLEMVPSAIAKQVTDEISIPTLSVGAGPHCDGQLLVWSDWAGFTRGRIPKFVKQYARIGDTLLEAAKEFRADVEAGVYPAPEHEYSDGT